MTTYASQASGQAPAVGRKDLRTHWFCAVIWNILGIPVGWHALFGDHALPTFLTVVLPMFSMVGFLLLFVAVRGTFRWRRFGHLKMDPDPLPGSVGGHVGGSLDLPLHQVSESDFRVVLLCVRDHVVRTSEGSQRSESVEWTKETVPRVERSAGGVRLRYTFAVPEGSPPSAPPSKDYYKWLIRVRGTVPGADLDQVFEVPVDNVDPPLLANDPVLSDVTVADVLELPERIVSAQSNVRGVILRYAAGRGGVGGFMMLIFGAVFAGAGVFAYVQVADMGSGFGVPAVSLFVGAFGGIFLLAFGGMGSLLMSLGFYSLVNSLVVEIRNGRITTRRSFFFTRSSEAHINDLTKIEMAVHSRVGQGVKSEAHVKIQATTRRGKRIPLGDGIPQGRTSEILVALLEDALGMQVETVQRFKLRARRG